MKELDPTTDPDVQEALSVRYGNSGIYIIPLRSGRFALISRGFDLHSIVEELPTGDELRNLSRDFQTILAQRSRLNAELRFYGEPDDRTLVRDIKTAQRPKALHPRTNAIEIDL